MSKLAAVRLVVALAAIPAMTTTVQAEEVQVTQKAREYYNAGMAFLREKPEPRYEEAYQAFRHAYAESPSWKILTPLGIAALHLERDQEALEAFERYLKEGGDDVPQEIRAQTERDIATLEASLVRVTITIDPEGGTQVVDERIPATGTAIVNRYSNLKGTTTLGIHPGRHRMSVSALRGAHGSEPWEFDARAGVELSHVFQRKGVPSARSTTPEPNSAAVTPSTTPLPPQTATPSKRTPALLYAGLAATGALLAGASVTGFLALQKNNEFQESMGSASNELRESGQQLALVTDVLFGVAVLAGAGTTYFYFSNRSQSADPSRAALYIRPSVGPESGWLAVSGRF